MMLSILNASSLDEAAYWETFDSTLLAGVVWNTEMGSLRRHARVSDSRHGDLTPWFSTREE